MCSVIGLLCFLILATVAVANDDQIEHLPGVNFEVSFKQYAGYLDADKGRKLFYWFVESEADPDNDPLVLWLNGGPGCSSIDGLLTENGPFRIHFDGKTVVKDDFSWNAFANVLYVEGPVNVGFSYNSTDLDPKEMYNDDAMADSNYHAIVDFFRKFPQFKSHKFYITGESYAGIYIPTLTRKILEHQSTNGINLQGIAIGNGVHDLGILSRSRVEFAYFHGLLGQDKWDQVQKDCCHFENGAIECDYPEILSNYTTIPKNNNLKCNLLVGVSLLQLKSFHINMYYVYDDCKLRHLKEAIHECVYNQSGVYLDQPEVRKALHVSDSLSGRKWTQCNQKILNEEYIQQYISTDQFYKDIVEKYKFSNIVFYNGDADIVCDFLSTQRFLLHHMNFTLSEPSRDWNLEDQLAGVQTRFNNGIRYFTIHGAGHMVPIQKPRQAIALIQELLGIKKID